jgi:hypothetical protein
MKVQDFVSVVGELVSKVSDRRPLELDPEFSVREYFDSGADDQDNHSNAFAAAANLLAEAGYLDTADPESELAERVTLREAIERVLA